MFYLTLPYTCGYVVLCILSKLLQLKNVFASNGILYVPFDCTYLQVYQYNITMYILFVYRNFGYPGTHLRLYSNILRSIIYKNYYCTICRACGGEALLTYSRENRHKADDRSLPVLRMNTVLLAKGFLVIDVSLMASRYKFCSGGRGSPRPAGFYDELSPGMLP